MNRDLIIFGVGKIAEVAYYYAKEECGFNVCAFCVDKEYISDSSFHNLPVIPFEEIERRMPPDRYKMFVAVGYHDLNKLRERKCKEAQNKSYELVSLVSPASAIPKNVTYGWNCFIMPPSIIHPFVKLGNNVFVWSGAIVGHHSFIQDHCWLTSGCNIAGNVMMGTNTFVAINATVSHSVKIGVNCFLGANTLLTKDLADNLVVIAESSKPLRVNSSQFLKISNFSTI